MFVKPAPGLKVREPLSHRLLEEAGRHVPENGFWMRRVRDGDVIRVETDEEREAREAAESAAAAAEEERTPKADEPAIQEHSALPAPAAEAE